MPAHATLDGFSETRQLARSLLHEVLGLPSDVHFTPHDGDVIPDTREARRWNKHMIYQTVMAWCDAHGRVPQWKEWRAASTHGLPSRSTVQAYWGSCGALMHAVRARRKKQSLAQKEQ